MGSCASQQIINKNLKEHNKQTFSQNLNNIKQIQPQKQSDSTLDSIEQSQDSIRSNEQKQEQEQNMKALQDIPIDQLEEITQMRFVNNRRIKEIIIEYQERGEEDPIARYKKQLYKKSQYSI